MKKFLFAVIVLSLSVSAFAKDLTAKCSLSNWENNVIATESVSLSSTTEDVPELTLVHPTRNDIQFTFFIQLDEGNEVSTSTRVVNGKMSYWTDFKVHDLSSGPFETMTIFQELMGIKEKTYVLKCAIE